MNRHHTFFILLALVWGLNAKTTALEFAGGTGQADDPYQIATPAQLIGIGTDPNLQDKHFVLIADLDMDPNLPDGQLLRSGLVLLAGSFDGAGHTISNLGGRIDRPEGRGGPYPFYGAVLFESVGSEVVVRNLNIQGEFFNSPATLADENEGEIINCSAAGTISIITTSAGGATWYNPLRGGLVRSNSGIIIGASVVVDLAYGSGLVAENSGTIVACHATGHVTDGPAGLVGINEGTIRGCYVLGNVQFSDGTAGGLVGINLGSISYCFASGDVTAQGNVGGLVGLNSGSVSYCYAAGNVSSQSEDEDENIAAGLVASNEGSIAYCYATGSGGMALVADNDSEAIIESCFALSSRDGGGEDNHLCIVLGDAQMRRQESFVGWDLAGTADDGTLDDWTMPVDGGYPVLTMIDGPEPIGNGTADDPYLVETYPQFIAISCSSEAYYRLTADLDLGGRSFSFALVPFFRGHFDGGGHCISNFTLTGRTNLGLFGTLYSEATVADLHIRRVRLVWTDERPYLSSTGVGTLAVCSQGTVTGCSAVTETRIEEGRFQDLGGLIGINEGGHVSMCWARLALGFRGSGGGLVGRNTGAIVQCHASTYANNCSGLGGLVGRNAGSISDCYAEGSLSRASGKGTIFVGGLVAENTGAIAGCYAATGFVGTPLGRGLVGGNLEEGSVIDSYFLAEADGGGADNGFGTELSDTEMRQQASFAGWDFENTWTIDDGNDYPRLAWEGI